MRLEDIKDGQVVHFDDGDRLRKVAAVLRGGVPGRMYEFGGYFKRTEFRAFAVTDCVYSEDELPRARKNVAARRKAEKQAEETRKAKVARGSDIAAAMANLGITGVSFRDSIPTVGMHGEISCRIPLEMAEIMMAAIRSADGDPA